MLLLYIYIYVKDAAGIVTSGPKGRLFQCKGNGMVRDVFNQSQLTHLIGSLGIGHGKNNNINNTYIYKNI